MADQALAQERLYALRETIARMEGKSIHMLGETGQTPDAIPVTADGRFRSCLSAAQDASPVRLDIPLLDSVLEGGVPRVGMAEIRSSEIRNAGGATGLALAFCACLVRDRKEQEPAPAILWIGERGVSREAGEPFAEGLADFGLGIEHLLYAAPRRLDEALWLAEAALGSGAFRAVILEIAGNPRRFGLSESRRLSIRARHSGSLLLLLRQGGAEEAGSTLFRLEAHPASSGPYRLPDGRELRGTIGMPVFSVTPEKTARPSPLSSNAISLEWNAHECLLARPDSSVPSLPGRSGPAHPGAGLPPPGHGPDRAAPMGTVLAFDRAS